MNKQRTLATHVVHHNKSFHNSKPMKAQNKNKATPKFEIDFARPAPDSGGPGRLVGFELAVTVDPPTVPTICESEFVVNVMVLPR